MNYDPYILIGESDKNILDGEIQHKIKAWHDSWFKDRDIEIKSKLLTYDDIEQEDYKNNNNLVVGPFNQWIAVKEPNNFMHCLRKHVYGNIVDSFSNSKTGAGDLTSLVVKHIFKDLLSILSLDQGITEECVQDYFDSKISLTSIPKKSRIPGVAAMIMDIRLQGINNELMLSKSYIYHYLQRTKVQSNKKIYEINAIEESLNNTKITAEICLGKASIQIQELAELKPGDVIKLDTKVNDDIELSIINTDIVYPVRLGKTRSKLAVLINNQQSNHM